MTNEQFPVDSSLAQEHVDTETQFNELWASGDKIGALEAAMGRYVNASEISANPDLATIILQPTASEAYGAALLVKTLEELTAEKPAAE
jgi:hypothetical protein